MVSRRLNLEFTMPKMIRVGMVGLGKMGSSMALNIAKAGFPLSMYDAEEGRTHELRENWVKDKHLPPGALHTTTAAVKCSTREAAVAVPYRAGVSFCISL